MNQLNRIRLVVSDIDGTLLNSQNRIPKTVLQTINRFTSSGNYFTLASGRTLRGMEKYIAAVGCSRLPVIALNGAVVKVPETGEVLLRQPLDRDVARAILQLADDYCLVAQVFYENDIAVDTRSRRRIISYFARRILHRGGIARLIYYLRRPVLIASDLGAFVALHPEPPYKIFITGEARATEEFRQIVLNRWSDEVVFTSALRSTLEINHKKATKGRALERVAVYLNLPLHSTLAIGDGTNDLSMIERAGLGVAMGNAVDLVKDSAGYITGTNDAGGLAQVLNLILGETSAQNV
ncbi:MAG: Cof-type HAD-IIB family hydrolase [Bacillota bacterium]